MKRIRIPVLAAMAVVLCLHSAEAAAPAPVVPTLQSGPISNNTPPALWGAVAEDQVLAKSLELAREIASCAPIAVRWTKRSLYQNVDWRPVPAAYAEVMRSR